MYIKFWNEGSIKPQAFSSKLDAPVAKPENEGIFAKMDATFEIIWSNLRRNATLRTKEEQPPNKI